MGKFKKLYKYSLIVLSTLILLLVAAFFALKNPAVQTKIGSLVMNRISEKIKAEISFDHMKFTFFNKVSFENILILDDTRDTLIFSEFLNLGIRKIDRKNRTTHLGRIYAENPVIGIRPDSSGEMNILYLLDLITPEDTAKRNKDLAINQIRIVNGRLKVSLNPMGPGNLDNMAFTELSLTIDNLRKKYSNLNMTLSELSFNTPGNFRATSIFTEIESTRDHFYLIDPTIRTSASFINSDLIGIEFVDRDSSFNFIEDARLNLKFNRSLISLSDIGYFVEALKDSKETMILSGKINGTISELKGRDIELDYSESTRIACDFDLSGLPDINNTFMFIDVEDMKTSTTEIESVKIPGHGYIDLGEEIRRLGSVSFRGNFTGFITDFVTYGVFDSELGSLSTDILFRPDTSNTFIYKGSLQARGFDAGRLIGRDDLIGILSLTAEVDGYSESFDLFRAKLDCRIDSLELNGYTYRDIVMNGVFTEKIWDGAVNSSTEDLKMDLLGRFDFNGDQPEFDFTLNLLDANLFALNLDPDDSTSRLSMLLTASFTGNNIDNIKGDIRLLNSRLTKFGENFDLYDASLTTGLVDKDYSIELRTDYVDADIRGQYNLRSIIDDLSSAVARLAPSLFAREEALYRITNNNFEYDIRLKNSNAVNEFFRTGLQMARGIHIWGRVDPDSLITLYAQGDYFTFNKNSLAKFNLESRIRDTTMALSLVSDKLSLANRIDLGSFTIKANTLLDDFNIGMSWNNPGNLRNYGEIKAAGKLFDLKNGMAGVNVDIKETTFYVRDQPWKIHPSVFRADSSTLTFDRFLVSHGEDYFSIDGKASSDSEDTLSISFNNLRLDALNSLSRKKSDNQKMEFIVQGSMDGNIVLKDVYNNFLFESNVLVSGFRANEDDYGDVTILSKWDNVERVAEISMSNNINGKNTFNIDGFYNPESKEIDFSTTIDAFPLDVLNLVLGSFASGIRGYGSGSVKIAGPVSAPELRGSVLAGDASMTIDYLKTKFNFSDSVIMDQTGFRFKNMAITDDKGNSATLNGYVAHTSFKDFEINLRINADNILSMDTRQKDNSLFYGTAYATGVISITGPATALKFDISARTGRNTRLFIPLNAGAEMNDYSFISFASPDSSLNSDKGRFTSTNLTGGNKSFELNFDLEVTPDAEVQLVFDSSVGDVMRGRGRGNLNLSLSRNGNFSIFGDYIIEDGDYLFTLGNIFNKRFVVEEGGTISWDGDIADADLNIKAIYKLRTSLFELLQDEAFRQRIPVECHLNMSGKLISPVIGFDIYLPTADEQTRTLLRNAINTEEEMSRQFLYLMVMNSFYPSSAYATAANTTAAGASAMGVTTTEMLSNQLSNWLSQISNDFDIGFAYRPGNEISSQEVEVALSTQLLNDRVVINGNFDVGGQETTSSTSNITGDFDVEVKLTEKFRLKVFNRSNDNIMYETSPYTQGFGFFFRRDFNRFRDIFRRNSGEMKKEEEPVVNDPAK